MLDNEVRATSEYLMMVCKITQNMIGTLKSDDMNRAHAFISVEILSIHSWDIHLLCLLFVYWTYCANCSHISFPFALLAITLRITTAYHEPHIDFTASFTVHTHPVTTLIYWVSDRHWLPLDRALTEFCD